MSLLPFYVLFFIRWGKHSISHSQKMWGTSWHYLYSPSFITDQNICNHFLVFGVHTLSNKHSFIVMHCCQITLLDIYYFEKCLSSNHYSQFITFLWYLLNHNHFFTLEFLEHFVSQGEIVLYKSSQAKQKQTKRNKASISLYQQPHVTSEKWFLAYV